LQPKKIIPECILSGTGLSGRLWDIYTFEAGNREELTSRIRMFLNIIEEDYHNLRITEVDIAEDRPTVNRFQVYDIPTLVLVNKYGHEVKRWMPVDFEISGGSITILQKEIDKLIKETETDDS
jgi:hypothetical protein